MTRPSCSVIIVCWSRIRIPPNIHPWQGLATFVHTGERRYPISGLKLFRSRSRSRVYIGQNIAIQIANEIAIQFILRPCKRGIGAHFRTWRWSCCLPTTAPTTTTTAGRPTAACTSPSCSAGPPSVPTTSSPSTCAAWIWRPPPCTRLACSRVSTGPAESS